MSRRAVTLATIIAIVFSCIAFGAVQAARLPHTVDVGVTGFANKRPVVAAACLKGCPWGELGVFLHQSMAPLGYDVILCENCNRLEGPRIVSTRSYPPPLSAAEMGIGTKVRVNAPIDFGITSTTILGQAYYGLAPRYTGHPEKNLRLITRIEDPYYVMVAVKASSGVTNLAQIAARNRPLRILADGYAGTVILKYYGLTKTRILAMGGSLGPSIGAPPDTPFDVLISNSASSNNNPESAFWSNAASKYNLRFLSLPQPLVARLLLIPDYERVTARCCLFRGMTTSIATVGWSGNDVFGRADMPDDVAYDIAKAIDQHRAALKWFVRPYSYDPNLAWHDQNIPLHPGAARYFQEKGYMP
jgi:TRAP-type uncharacterized transport system substrate-binding protein